jgi:hypothetical protein
VADPAARCLEDVVADVDEALPLQSHVQAQLGVRRVLRVAGGLENGPVTDELGLRCPRVLPGGDDVEAAAVCGLAPRSLTCPPTVEAVGVLPATEPVCDQDDEA